MFQIKMMSMCSALFMTIALVPFLSVDLLTFFDFCVLVTLLQYCFVVYFLQDLWLRASSSSSRDMRNFVAHSNMAERQVIAQPALLLLITKRPTS